MERAARKTIEIREGIRAEWSYLQKQRQSPDSLPSVEALRTQFRAVRPQAAAAIDWSKQSDWRTLKERIWNARDDSGGAAMPPLARDGEYASSGVADEGDFSVTVSRDIFVCPITQQPFKDPYRSTTCGHVFEREAVMNMLRSNRNIPCPVGGCRHHLSQSMLQQDTELHRRMEQGKRKRLFKPK